MSAGLLLGCGVWPVRGAFSREERGDLKEGPGGSLVARGLAPSRPQGSKKGPKKATERHPHSHTALRSKPIFFNIFLVAVLLCCVRFLLCPSFLLAVLSQNKKPTPKTPSQILETNESKQKTMKILDRATLG